MASHPSTKAAFVSGGAGRCHEARAFGNSAGSSMMRRLPMHRRLLSLQKDPEISKRGDLQIQGVAFWATNNDNDYTGKHAATGTVERLTGGKMAGGEALESDVAQIELIVMVMLTFGGNTYELSSGGPLPALW
ncbi:hypothetical protein WJX73_010471 [Symbiochloris irregularis]|uniref:Uncharacterized protein n=1 Tax=Symbiochloris irregularis TaxID=706552 RepID=A0AAW1NZY8_9CHLO